MSDTGVIRVSLGLDSAGLVWNPVIGDEVVERGDLSMVAILVDPQGMTPPELRQCFLWLPTVEQLIEELEARQAKISHAGTLETNIYEVMVEARLGVISASATSLRVALGEVLQTLILEQPSSNFFH